ncbi:MAG TPA: metal ABC transporter ATP-binding protein [Candidatus Rothia avicola]|uniref:Metal ABC transporter ATP-binding protein n=1 Tax=Candidatus Rothia avicola TaxID=2840478 RepID=A0A9D2CQY6_9MICC|nr:metal ABC transporter ATP-binding protein [Candidatus Rothia avicola]
MSLLDIRDVTVTYGDVHALRGAHLAVDAGSVCGLVGMNGSGKSTLFKAIMGVAPASGSVMIDGMTPKAARKAGVVSYVPQREEIDFSFPVSVRDVVAQGRYGRLGFARRLRSEDHAAVDKALERVELTDLAHRQIGNLSGGQRKRAFVARGLAQGAKLLLLDEPFAGVDKRSETMLVTLLRELRDAGAGILISTHDLANLADLADTAVLLRNQVLMAGDPTTVLAPDNLVRAFGMNPLTPTQEGNRA